MTILLQQLTHKATITLPPRHRSLPIPLPHEHFIRAQVHSNEGFSTGATPTGDYKAMDAPSGSIFIPMDLQQPAASMKSNEFFDAEAGDVFIPT
jgi:hypothetical protein